MTETEVSKAWWRMRTKFLTAANPWGAVKGPIGATIGTLDMIHWNPVTPYKWIAQNGDTWAINRHGSYAAMLEEIHEHLDTEMWLQAAQHCAGSGLEGDADLTVIRKHGNRLIPQDAHKDGGTLTTIGAGGIWTHKRLHDAGIIADPSCPHCGAENHDACHMFWECAKLDNREQPEITKSQYLKTRAIGYKDKVDCLWLRGIVPRTYTWRSKIEDDRVFEIGTISNLEPSKPIFLDGSGGINSRDKRIRACGWAWVQIMHRHDAPSDEIGQYGPLGGKQTVPRAEAMALLA